MHSYGKSSQLFVTLYICSSLTLFLQTYDEFSKASVLSAVIAVAVEAVVTTAFFIPSYLLLLRENGDIFTLSHRFAPAAEVPLSAFYSLFFVYTSASVLDVYVKMMTGCVNPEANAYVLGGCLLLICIYAAVKGMGAVTRSGIIIFAFILLSFLLIFFGNISNIELSNMDFSGFSQTQMISCAFSMLPTALSSSIFAVLCGNTTGKRGKPLFAYIAGITLTLATFVFFLIAVLGEFGKNALYPFYTLSKTAQLAVVKGLDCVYLAGASSAAFILLSMLLICINKTVNRGHSLKNTLMFAVPVYILFICSQKFTVVSDTLQNPYVLIVLCFIVSVLIPLAYLGAFWRKKNV